MKIKNLTLPLLFSFLIFTKNECSAKSVNLRNFYKKADFVFAVWIDYKVDVLNFRDSTKTLTKTYTHTSERGSGTIVRYKGKKYLITNSHIVLNSLAEIGQALLDIENNEPIVFPAGVAIFAKPLKIHTKNNRNQNMPVTVRYLDTGRDLAIIEPSDQKILPKLEGVRLEDGKIEITDPIMTIGNPQNSEFGFFTGRISEFKEFELEPGSTKCLFIVTSPLADHGSSGSPLLNKSGRLIGIIRGVYFNNALPTTTAIHAKEIRAFLENFEKSKEKSKSK